KRYMVTAVLFEPSWQILLRHEQAAGVAVADIEHDQLTPIVVLRHLVDRGGTGEAVHHAKADGEMIEHGGEQAANRALLAPHFDADRLLGPKVATVRARDAFGEFGGIGPGRRPFERAGLVDDPLPRDDAPLAGLFEQAIDALHFVARH